MKRVMVYIDGFNLYYGLKSKGWKRYYWLNIENLAQNLLRPGQRLVECKYFTARISTDDRGKHKRQGAYLEALDTLGNVKIYFGHYLQKTVTCFNCKNTWSTYEEKMTDVCIATELLTDAFNNRFDVAILVSGDSDLSPPTSEVRKQIPEKKIVIAFPPERVSKHLKKVAHSYIYIGKDKLRKSMFPDQVTSHDGYVLQRPPEWRENVKPMGT